MKIWKLIFLMVFIFQVVLHAQQGSPRSYTSYNHLWTGFEFQQKISDRTTLGTDAPYRRQSVDRGSLKIYDHLQHAGVRLWATFSFSDELTLSISPFAYFYSVPQTHRAEELSEWQDEIRFTLRVRHSPQNSVISHRYGFERRHRKDFEEENWQENRIRYRLRLNTQVLKDYHIISDNEIFLSLGQDVAYNIFDANRFFFGLRRIVNETKITLGYQNSLEQQSSGKAFHIIHALVISLSYRSTLGD